MNSFEIKNDRRITRSFTALRSAKFQFKKALIVTKLSRLEFEQHKNPKLSVAELEKMLRDRGTDFDALLQYHRIHKEFETTVAESFRRHNIDVKLVNRFVVFHQEMFN